MSVDDEFKEKPRTTRTEDSEVTVTFDEDGKKLHHHHRIGLEGTPEEQAEAVEELQRMQKKYPSFTALILATEWEDNGNPCGCDVCSKLYRGGHTKAWREIKERTDITDGKLIHDSFVSTVDKHGPKMTIQMLDRMRGWGAFSRLVSAEPIPTKVAAETRAEMASLAANVISDPAERGRFQKIVKDIGAILDDKGGGLGDAARLAVEELEAAATDTLEAPPAGEPQDTKTEDTKMATINQVTMDVAATEDGKVKAKPPMSGKWKEMGIVREGTQIILPESMTHNEAIEWIKRRRDEEMRTVAVHEEIVGYPLDAAIAFVKALQEVKGFISLAATPSFFGEEPPVMVTVETGVGVTTQVPWGRMKVPGIEGYVETHIGKKDGLPTLIVAGEVQLRFREEVAQIASVARRILRDSSIYRGKAIRVHFPEDGAKFDPSLAPSFIDVSEVREDHLIFPEAVQRQVTTSIFTPIVHTEKCRKAKIPLKRGILLEGPYGCGKTLTANVTAKKCQDNGWTFIYLNTVADLDQAIQFARSYQPACIFAEDIDRVVEGERTVEMDSILNTIDGVDTKSSELMVILTTNHVEDINRAMLRPGRLDAVIPVRAPDASAAERLVRQYGTTMLRAGDDLTEVGKRLAGQIPAVIREVVERSKLSAVAHQATEGGELTVTADDLFTAADGMVTHLELLAKEEIDETPGEAMARTFGEHLGRYLNKPRIQLASLDAITEQAGVNGSNKHA